MRYYALTRWICSDCGMQHSLVQRRGARPMMWVCPVCLRSSMPAHTCTGMCAKPDFGCKETFVIAHGVGERLGHPSVLVGCHGRYKRVSNG